MNATELVVAIMSISSLKEILKRKCFWWQFLAEKRLSYKAQLA